MRFLVLLFGVAALFMVADPVLVLPAAAGGADECVKGTGDEKIAACTRSINSGLWKGPNLAWAYTNRGIAYRAKGEPDRAIADYDKAIWLNPKFADAYNRRGSAYDDRGDRDRAIADYDQAIRLNPNFAEAYNNRGIAYRAKGQPDRAIADYDRAIRSIRISPWPFITGASRTTSRRILTAPSRTTTKPFNLTRITCKRTKTGALQNEPKVILPEAMPTLPKQSS